VGSGGIWWDLVVESNDSTRSWKLVESVVESFDSTATPKLPRVAVYRWKSVESTKINCRVVAVVPASKAEPRGPFAERLYAEEEVGNAKAVDTVVPGAGVGGYHAQPRVADVAHVVLVIEVETGKAEAGGRAGELDSEVVGAAERGASRRSARQHRRTNPNKRVPRPTKPTTH
jgi:hypothetical protein